MLTAIRNWVIRTMMKAKGQTGVVQTLPKRDIVEINTQITAQKLMQNGIDPEALKNADQVENAIIAIENRPKVQEGIQSTKSAKIFNTAGEELDPNQPIIGGTQPGKKIDTDAFIRNAEAQELETKIQKKLEKGNKEAAQRIRMKKMVDDAIDDASPGFSGDRKVDAELVAENLAERMGKVYDDLPTKERLDLYDQAFQGLTKKRFDPEDMAQGGRAGFKTGLGKRFLELLKNKKMFRSKDDVPTSIFSEKKGPITIEDMANIPENQLRKIRRTQELGLYTETPEILKAGNLFERFTKKVGGKRVIDYDRAEFILNRKLRGDETLDELLQIEYQTRPGRADGGIMRLGLKEGSGMTRRTFLKLLGGMAAIPIVGKFFKLAKVGKTVTKVPLIKTDNVPGKPEWFDALVNKVIIEGDDVTKKFATGERQSIHQKTLDDGSVVRVTEDIDDGAVRVEYESEANVFGDPVQLQYKKPLPDESDPRPTAEFTTAESGPVGRQSGPDDYDLDVDEVGGTSIRDLDSDVSKLKQYATGKGPTMREIVQNKKRRDKAQRITEDPEAQTDAVIRRQGEMLDVDPDPDFASGGIARMLGE